MNDFLLMILNFVDLLDLNGGIFISRDVNFNENYFPFSQTSVSCNHITPPSSGPMANIPLVSSFLHSINETLFPPVPPSTDPSLASSGAINTTDLCVEPANVSAVPIVHSSQPILTARQ